MAIEKKNFLGGLNSDIEDRLMPTGDYRYALNVRASKSDGANEGSIENTKGNTLISFPMPNGDSKVLGALDNIRENKVIYFLYNGFGNHSIREFDASTKTIVTLLETPLLNFQPDNYILDSFLIDDILTFNDRVNPPRSLNITRLRGRDYPVPFKESYLNLIVEAPGKPLTAEFKSDSSVLTNNVRNKLFQFRYKYVYLDNEESAWSPISKTATPISEAEYRPIAYYPLNVNNFIRISIPLGGDDVKRVKIAARELNTGDFFLAEDIDKSKLSAQQTSPPLYDYDFYNDEVYTSIDNDGNSGMRLFDNVPQFTDSISPIDGNKIALGGVTENYDPVDIDIETNVVLGESVAVESTSARIIGSDTVDYRNIGYLNEGWYASRPLGSSTADNSRRKINGSEYVVIFSQKLNYRNTPPYTNSSEVGFQNSNTIFIPIFSGYSYGGFVYGVFKSDPYIDGTVYDRSLVLSPTSSKETHILSGSFMHEIAIKSPNAAGVRYVLNLKAEYMDLGETDNFINKNIRVQYTSQAGDSALDVARGLQQRLSFQGDVGDGNMVIKASNSRASGNGGWSFTSGSNVQSDEAILRVYVEGYAVESEELPNRTEPNLYNAIGEKTPSLKTCVAKLSVYAGWTLENKRSLKSGTTGGIGIVYYDSPNRSGLTNISSVTDRTLTTKLKNFKVPFFTERNITPGFTPTETTLSVDINHTPPSWAKRYQIVYTGNQTIEYIPGVEGYKGFLQFRLGDVTPSGRSVSGSLKSNLNTVYEFNDEIPDTTALGYSWSKGDRVRFISQPVSSNSLIYLNNTSDVEVISFDVDTRELIFQEPDFEVKKDMVVEIYTPKKRVDEALYYEVGECYDIVNGLHTGFVNQTSTTPATVVLEDIGDVYLRYRTASFSHPVEDYAFSDFYSSDAWNKGRPNRVDNNIKRVKRPATVRFSNNYIPNTNINGLSQFDDFDFEDYDQQYGSIERMYGENKDLILFQNLKVGKVRVSQTTLYGNDGTSISTLKAQDKILSDIVYYNGEYGIGVNPESFAVYGNRLYFADVRRGAVLRLGNDGLTPISEYGMHNYFNDTFKSIIDKGSNYKVFGVFDVRFGEYVISIQEGYVSNKFDVTTGELTEERSVLDGGGVVTDPLVELEAVGFGDQLSEDPNATTTENLEAVGFGDQLIEDPDATTTENLAVVGFGDQLSEDPNATTTAAETADEVFSPENPNPILNDTIAFSELKKKWVTFYSYVPDIMVSNNIDLISFKNGELYTHNSNNTYNNFYGLNNSTYIELISNMEPSKIKVYNHLLEESTHKFAVPLITNQFGQKSSLIEDDFDDREGVWKASFLRDENTPNVALPLIEGDDLRCHSMSLLIKNSDTELVKLFSVGLGLVISHLTDR